MIGVQPSTEQLVQLGKLLDAGTLRTVVTKTYPLSQAQAAWAEFARRYGRLIYQWCRRWQLAETEAEEVTQTVLVRLVEKLGRCDYDPARSFRAYLKTLTHYAWCDFLEGRKRPGSGDKCDARWSHASGAGGLRGCSVFPRDRGELVPAEFQTERVRLHRAVPVESYRP